MYYFVRVNGHTLHNNPSVPRLYVPEEPPRYPNTYFDALSYCLQNDFVRIGWPGTGDLSSAVKNDFSGAPYSFKDFTDAHREYLRKFFNITEKSVILMPDKANSGNIYLGKVTRTYHYFNDVPIAPYEHSHRLGIRWVRGVDGKPTYFRASDLGIKIRGGFWTRAFHALSESPTGRSAIPLIAKHLEAG